MMSRALLGRTLHAIGWSSLCGFYLLVSIPKVLPHLVIGRLSPAESFSSTDSYLLALTGTAHASAQILNALAPLPRDKIVVLVLPDAGTLSAFIAQNVTYLSWPREVRWLTASNGQVELYAMAPSTLAAVIFWDVAPFPGLPSGIRLGPSQVVVPIRRPDSPPA